MIEWNVDEEDVVCEGVVVVEVVFEDFVVLIEYLEKVIGCVLQCWLIVFDDCFGQCC